MGRTKANHTDLAKTDKSSPLGHFANSYSKAAALRPLAPWNRSVYRAASLSSAEARPERSAPRLTPICNFPTSCRERRKLRRAGQPLASRGDAGEGTSPLPDGRDSREAGDIWKGKHNCPGAVWAEDRRATGPEPAPQPAPGGVGRRRPARRPPSPTAARRPRSGPGEAARPCGRTLPDRSLPRASRAPAGPPVPRRRGRSPPAGPLPGSRRPRPRRGPAHLHLFAEAAWPRHCQRPGPATAATPGAPASRPRHRPGAGSPGRLPSVRLSVAPASRRRLSGTRAGCS